MPRTLISSGSPFEKAYGYSRAVVDGEWIFLSGTTGYDYATMTLADGVAAQCEQAFKTISAVLAEAGSSLADAVRVNYLLPNREDFRLCQPVIERYLGDIRPAGTMMVVGLLEPAMLIEIEVTARKRG